MRQKLNENPVAQIALVGILLLLGGFFVVTKVMGGSESTAESETPVAATSSPEAGASAETGPAPSSAGSGEIVADTSAISAPASRPLPHAVDAAYKDDSTIAVLIVRDGGIDDHLVTQAAKVLEGMPHVAFFSAKAKHIARFSTITGPLGVNRAPALIVIRPRRFNGKAPAPASVTYGFQSKSDVRQAVRDAVYRGPQLTYAPN